MYKTVVLSIAFIIAALHTNATEKPRVFIFTDINIEQGDPDDRQSLVHLFWYANELKIEGIVPERWNAQGYEACELVLDRYESDYAEYKWKRKGYPKANNLHKIVAKDWDMGKKLFIEAASKEESPLYVLIWGNMQKFGEALTEKPELSKNIRVLTIGTGLMLEENIQYIPKSWKELPPCQMMNWNARGRNAIYNDSRFDNMWWLEMNWTYNGMFPGEEPKEMFHKLSEFGAMGAHIKDVVKNHPWAQYFRVGDTPTVLYVIDKSHNIDDPTQSSFAGKFTKPFPAKRPNYYTDFCDSLNWNYNNPCSTWQQHENFSKTASNTLLERRNEMYNDLLLKLEKIYTL